MKKKYRGFLVNDTFLGRSEVKDTIYKDGITSLARLICVCMYMMRCFNAIVRFEDIKPISTLAHTQTACMRKWIMNCGIFKIDEKNGIFTYNYIRHMFGKQEEVTEREIYLVKKYGNHITEDPEAVDADATDFENISENNEELLEKNSKNNEKVFKNQHTEESDNKDVSAPLNIISNTNKNINNNISNRNRNININISRETDDADDESSFNFFEKKLFNARRWREATSSSHVINIDDDNVMHIFTKWMYNYCVSTNEMRKVDKDIFSYASNLLIKGRAIRKMFEDYLKTKLEEQRRAREEKLREREPRHVNKAAFETIRDGKRYALGGQELPNDAPKQTDARWRWSYRMHKYVDISEFEEKKEMDFFNEQKRKEKEADEAWCKKQIEACNKRLAAEEQLRHSKALDKSSESS